MTGCRSTTLFTVPLVGALLGLGSTAFACITQLGQMTVDGDDGDTTVVGLGATGGHQYCSTGRPTSAAAGHIQDNILVTVDPASCADSGTVVNHQLPDKTYEVRYTNKKSFNFTGTQYTLITGTGCYSTPAASSTTTPGSINVVDGSGLWTGQLGTLAGAAYYSLTPLEAAQICVYDPASHTGMIAPYRLLLI